MCVCMFTKLHIKLSIKYIDTKFFLANYARRLNYLSVSYIENDITKMLSCEDVIKGDIVKHLNKTYYRSVSNG